MGSRRRGCVIRTRRLVLGGDLGGRAASPDWPALGRHEGWEVNRGARTGLQGVLSWRQDPAGLWVCHDHPWAWRDKGRPRPGGGGGRTVWVDTALVHNSHEFVQATPRQPMGSRGPSPTCSPLPLGKRDSVKECGGCLMGPSRHSSHSQSSNLLISW